MSAVETLSGRLSLRPPQREALNRLSRLLEVFRPTKNADPAVALALIRTVFPDIEDFERDFPSLCFELATGVGKTRLMGAFIAYLHAEHGLSNFFVLAPGTTIYEKLLQDFTPNTPKYVFRGLGEFAVEPPAIITAENGRCHRSTELRPSGSTSSTSRRSTPRSAATARPESVGCLSTWARATSTCSRVSTISFSSWTSHTAIAARRAFALSTS